ncbi:MULTISPECIES: alanine racemase [unclassified Bosea (in: a-proteobacteria)]|uniref:alanine racemase n=1 Tax=unclassified Bosea (in: a-proteobacteria) TaxID=2653178 RepID=UPI000F74C77E|nr:MULTISPECIES: alanine racemase [unclassified Bosea (in: a-proteobacteria)]AZO77401.1 alanine racemase [Bosea sp. Tri-49]RXT22261.1 alanine racemase [Bosea sp. Tri-39]RXT32603.1 alanine racemase [Bosea sp. Tri-54]
MNSFDTPENAGYGALLTIDLDALAANWRMLRQRAGTEASAVVKANAYGIGIEPAVTALTKAGCKTFFVAHLSEAVRARAVAPDATIYVLNGLAPESGGTFAEHDLSPVLGSHEELLEWAGFRQRGAKVRPAALHVDTAMNRLGLWPGEGLDLAREKSGVIAAAGIGLLMSHFASSEVVDDPANARQIAAFAEIAAAFPGVPASLLNSSGHFLPNCPSYQLTRPGYALYGGNPTPGKPNPMRPVVGLEARIIQLREVQAGMQVGYNGTWTAKGRSKLATICLGYADGYPRNGSWTDHSQGGSALVGGVRCPFVGTVSMDLIIVDISDAPADAAVRGAPVTLIGGELDLEAVGAGAKTIGYEILTSLGRRHARRYVGL